MKRFFNLPVIFIIVILLGSCAAHHPYAKARPKPGKKKSCNCPDFGYNPGKSSDKIYFYINQDIYLKYN